MADEPRYEVRKGKYAPCALWSVVHGKSWGGTVDTDFENFVCEGTYTYCNKVKESLENGSAY